MLMCLFQTTNTKPIILVCHSLGGIIAKQALCVANKQFPRYGTLVNAVAGIIFLSTPHRYGDKTTSLMRFRDILEATTGKSVKFPSVNIEQEGAVLLDLADRFEAISLRTPVLSVYELRESKISTTSLRSKHQQVSLELLLLVRALNLVVVSESRILFNQGSNGNSHWPQPEPS